MCMCYVDLDSSQLTQKEFIELLIQNDIFGAFFHVIVEEKTEDRDFIVYSLINSFIFHRFIIIWNLLLCLN